MSNKPNNLHAREFILIAILIAIGTAASMVALGQGFFA